MTPHPPKVPASAPDDTFHCGDCLFWHPVEPAGAVTIGAPKLGVCFGSPPQVVPVINNGKIAGGVNIRPQTPSNEMACSLYMDRDAPEDEPEEIERH